MAIATYHHNGVRFDYPKGWELEVAGEDEVTTVSVHAPDGLAFALVTVDESRPEPAFVADEALAAMREEYPALEAAPALETIGGHKAVGHDVEFISLDLTNTCTIRCFRSLKRTVLLFEQWSDVEDEETTEALVDLRRSLAETDVAG